MGERRTGVTVAVAMLTGVAAALFAGCSPQPQPTFTPTPAPAPTAFASDEEAFAAAEATYRAYVDAVNARRAGHPRPNPAELLTGEALRSEADTLAFLERRQLRILGETSISSFVSSRRTTAGVSLVVCLDGSKTKVVDAGGEDVTPTTRVAVSALEVEFEAAPGKVLISRTVTSEVEC